MSNLAILLTIAIVQGNIALGLALGCAIDLRRK